MADPTPAPITNEVINSLNGFVVKGKRKIDPLELRRLRRKIDELAKVSRYEADVLHGILAVYENDEERMRSRFANAIALRPNDEWVISNYVKALRAYGLIYDALECARKLVRVSSSADALSDYLALVSVTLEFEDAEALYERVRKAHTGGDGAIQMAWGAVERARAVVAARDLDLAEVRRCTDGLWAFFRQQGWIISCRSTTVLSDLNEIHHELNMPGVEPDEIAKTNFLIAGALIEMEASDAFLSTIIYSVNGSSLATVTGVGNGDLG